MGGGMRSSYGAGFLHALRTEFEYEPDILIGTSGNAANACYFAANQTHDLQRIWCDVLPRSGVVNPLRFWKIFDVDRMVREIISAVPLDLKKLCSCPMDLLIPITDAETGVTAYERPTEDAAHELLRAAVAIPFFYGKRVFFGNRPYIDGEVGPTLSDHVREALERGATRIVVMNNGWPDNAVRHAVKHVVAYLEPQGLRKSMERDFGTNSYICMTGPTGTNVTCIFPDVIPAHFLERNSQRLTESFEAGRACARLHRQEIF